MHIDQLYSLKGRIITEIELRQNSLQQINADIEKALKENLKAKKESLKDNSDTNGDK